MFRLVVKIAYDYSNLGLPLLDLIPEGISVGQDDQRGTDQQEKLPVPEGLHFIYPLLNRGVTAAVGGGGDNARISAPKHP